MTRKYGRDNSPYDRQEDRENENEIKTQDNTQSCDVAMVS